MLCLVACEQDAQRSTSMEMERVEVRSIPAMVATYRRFAEVPFLSVRVTGS